MAGNFAIEVVYYYTFVCWLQYALLLYDFM